MKKKTEKKKETNLEEKYINQKEEIKKLIEKNLELRKILYEPVYESTCNVKRRFDEIIKKIVDEQNIHIYISNPSTSVTSWIEEDADIEYECTLSIVTDAKTYVTIDKFINDFHILFEQLRELPK